MAQRFLPERDYMDCRVNPFDSRKLGETAFRAPEGVNSPGYHPCVWKYKGANVFFLNFQPALLIPEDATTKRANEGTVQVMEELFTFIKETKERATPKIKDKMQSFFHMLLHTGITFNHLAECYNFSVNDITQETIDAAIKTTRGNLNQSKTDRVTDATYRLKQNAAAIIRSELMIKKAEGQLKALEEVKSSELYDRFIECVTQGLLKEVQLSLDGVTIYAFMNDLYTFLDREDIIGSRVFKPGAYLLPAAVLGIPTYDQITKLKILTPKGQVHPHPHVQAGAGDGKVCWGEVHEDRTAHCDIIRTCWDNQDIKGLLNFLNGFLTSRYEKSRYPQLWTIGKFNVKKTAEMASKQTAPLAAKVKAKPPQSPATMEVNEFSQALQNLATTFRNQQEAAGGQPPPGWPGSLLPARPPRRLDGTTIMDDEPEVDDYEENDEEDDF